MGHYDSCRDGYCAGCGAAPGNMVNGKCPFCAARRDKLKDTTMKTAKRWTFDELDRMAKMIIKGASNSMIGKALGRTTSAVASLKSDKSPTRDVLEARIAYNKGGTGSAWNKASYTPVIMTVKPVITKMTTPKSKPAKAVPKNHRAKWTDQQDLELVLSYNKGKSASELAAMLGRTKYAVVGRLHTLGILTFDKDTMTYYTKPQHYYKIKVKPA